jgi:uncharacterized membrane protein YhaH (DUF805 family)
MKFLRNPYFITALLLLVLGCFGIAVSWMTGLILLVIGFMAALAGVTTGVMRTHDAHKQGIELHE